MQTLRNSSRPIVTQVLIGINAVVFLLTAVGGGSVLALRDEAQVRFATLGYWPGDPFSSFQLGVPLEPIGVDAGEWFRLVSGGFMHANLLHIGMNMFLLWILGQAMEPALGRLRFSLVYGVSLLAGSFGAILAGPSTFTVGASGAVFGLMGAMLVAQRASGIDPWRSGIGGLVLINLLLTFTIGGISIGGHIGGLVGGALAGFCLVDVPSRLSSSRRDGLAIGIALVVLLGAACIVGGIWAAGTWADPLFSDAQFTAIE